MSNVKIFNIQKDSLDFDFQFNTKETSILHAELNNTSSISMNDIRRVALWKLSRVINIPEDLLENLGKLSTNKNLSHRDEISTSIIKALVVCEGVGYPMASTILKFLQPEIYPIIDIRAYRALTGKKLYSSSYNLDLYLNYIDQIKEISLSLGIPMNSVDEQLYCFDKEFNKNI